MATQYLITWKNDYPARIHDDGLVFLTSHHKPMTYAGLATQLKKIAHRSGITKRVTPHLFRHARVTHLRQKGYSESTIMKMIWGNPNTSMLATYAHLTDADIDDEILSREGIKPPKIPGSGAMAPCQCANCGAVNTPTQSICSVCGQPLDEQVRKSIDRIKKEIETSDEFKLLIQFIRNHYQDILPMNPDGVLLSHPTPGYGEDSEPG
jgi:hypothetical protein